jgi:hypothetical protein
MERTRRPRLALAVRRLGALTVLMDTTIVNDASLAASTVDTACCRRGHH